MTDRVEGPSREELLVEELEVLGRHLAEAGHTINRLKERVAHLEAREARTLRSRLRRVVDRALGVPAAPSILAELPPAPSAG